MHSHCTIQSWFKRKNDCVLTGLSTDLTIEPLTTDGWSSDPVATVWVVNFVSEPESGMER